MKSAHLMVLLTAALVGCYGLNFSLNERVQNSRAQCEMLCVEDGLTSLTAANKTEAGYDPTNDTHQVASISSLQVFKVEETSLGSNNGGMRRRLLASVSSQKSRLNRVSDGIKVDGRLEAGVATLRLEFVKQDDCLNEFVCQAQGVDHEGKTKVSISHILRQSKRDSTGLTDAASRTDGPGIQVLAMLQEMSSKLEVLSSSVSSLKDDLRRMEENSRHDSEALRSKLDSKTDRLEDKIQYLEKDLDTQTDRLEDKIEEFEKSQNKKINQLAGKTEDIINRLEDKFEYLKNQRLNTDSCSEITTEDVKGIIKTETTPLETKLSTIKDDLTTFRTNLADSVNINFFKISQKLDSWKTDEHNLNKTSTTLVCQDSHDLVDEKLDSLQNEMQGKFNELSASLNLSAMKTNTLINAQSLLRNATFGEGLETALSDLLTPKACYKGMSSLTSFSSSPYAVVQPSKLNSLTAPVLCDTFTDGGGWVVFQRRVTGDVSFYRKWQDYKNGFGSLDGDFWLGNDHLSALTKNGVFELRIDMMYNGKFAYAQYDSFSVGDESTNYVLHVSNYKGTAGDPLTAHNNLPFSTHDRDNDSWGNNCAVEYVGAWWYGACHSSNLNGQWGSGGNKGPRWSTFSGDNAVTYSEMKFRRLI